MAVINDTDLEKLILNLGNPKEPGRHHEILEMLKRWVQEPAGLTESQIERIRDAIATHDTD